MTRTDKPTVAYLTAGGAGMFCGSCMRDNTLAAALVRLGCDVVLVPLYTPIRTDEPDVSINRVFFGGINVYLQQRFTLFRHMPHLFDRWLDQPWLIRRVARGNIKVEAYQLGEMTLSMLRGEHGHQRKEVLRLVSWLARQVRPQLINLSNIMIAGCTPEIKHRLDVPVLVTLQGDDLFLDELIEPYKSQVMQEIRRVGQWVDGFIVFSHFYADFMAQYLGLPREKFHIVSLGVSLHDYRPAVAEPSDRPPTIGYFARICPEKGFHLLVDAFLRLAQWPGMEQVRLRAAGWLGARDQAFFDVQLDKIKAAGLDDRFHYDGALERAEKLAFYRGLDVLSVPTVYHEPKGLFVLEALASGVPVVQPAHGIFPELLAATGGGRLVPPNDPQALAEGLQALLLDGTLRQTLGAQGRSRVHQEFSAERMAAETLAVYRQILARDAVSLPRSATGHAD